MAQRKAHTKAVAVLASASASGAGVFLLLWQHQQSEKETDHSNHHNSRLPGAAIHLLNSSDSTTASTPQALWWLSHHVGSNTATTSIAQCQAKVDPGYPDLSRFGKHSYLKKYLTPEIYAALKQKKTRKNVTLEDLISAGVTLPSGARPVRGCGIYAGDAESYQVFSKLLDPIVEDWHHLREDSLRFRKKPVPPPEPTGKKQQQQQQGKKSSSNTKGVRISRQATNLNPGYVLRQNLDPDGSYILQTRMRVARSVTNFPFSPKISREQRRELEQLIQDCTQDFAGAGAGGGDDNDETDVDHDTNNNVLKGTYTRVMDMTNEQHADWIHRHILFHDPDPLSLNAGLGRDWPDARGIYMNHTTSLAHHGMSQKVGVGQQEQQQQQKLNKNAPSHHVSPELMIWVNAEDHLRIISMSKGGDLLGVFTRLSKAIGAMEAALQKRGYGYESDPRLGFLNTSPENVGTALRASVFVKLPRLGQEPGFEELLARLRLESSTRFRGEHRNNKNYTGIFDIANSERLGQSEVQLINTMINGVGRLIALEKKLENGEKVDLEFIH
ncbi:MAG: hypothetical protein SGBAC_003208 [Bacillariaceae sp.]